MLCSNNNCNKDAVSDWPFCNEHLNLRLFDNIYDGLINETKNQPDSAILCNMLKHTKEWKEESPIENGIFDYASSVSLPISDTPSPQPERKASPLINQQQQQEDNVAHARHSSINFTPDSPKNFDVLSQSSAISDNEYVEVVSGLPIVDIGVYFPGREKPPPGHMIIKKSIDYHKADLNRGTGGRDVFLTFRRQTQPNVPEYSESGQILKPITALNIFFPSINEEMVYGFEAITTTSSGLDADLSAASGGVKCYLAIRRGDGPHITDLAVLLKEKREVCPVGYHLLKFTSWGNPANLNYRSDGMDIYLCYRINCNQPIIDMKPVMVSSNPCLSRICHLYASILATSYCGHENVALSAIKSIKSIPDCIVKRYPEKFNQLLSLLVENIHAYCSYFTPASNEIMLTVFEWSFTTFSEVITLDTTMRILYACMVLRHEDKHTRASRHIIDFVIKNMSSKQVDCNCWYTFQRRKRHVLGKKNKNVDIENAATPRNSVVKDKKSSKEDSESKINNNNVDNTNNTCRRCQLRAQAVNISVKDHCNSLVSVLLQNVILTKSVETDINTFLRHQYVDNSFISLVSRLVTFLFKNPYESKYVAMILVLCKFASEYQDFNRQKSERTKRKAHSIALLLHVLKHSGDFFTDGGVGYAPGLPITPQVIILRRFVCTSLLNACVTDTSIIFRLLSNQMFVLMWQKFRDVIPIELGITLDTVFISMLEAPTSAVHMKLDIIEGLIRLVESGPSVIIDLFYNYDNDSKNWNIYERFVIALASVLEGDLLQMSPLELDSEFKIDPGEDRLRRRALRLMVNVMKMLAKWTNVPQFREENAAEGLPVSVLVSPTKMTKKSGRSTWVKRHNAQKEQQKAVAHAVKLSREKDLKTALKYLKVALSQPQALPKTIAHFLYNCERLDKAQVGDILGNTGDSFMSKEEYEQLRKHYCSLIDFTRLSFDDALRMFLCDSKFRLPGESQKVDRLLSAFADAYCRDNPDVFASSTPAYVMSFALVMLNTDIHDPRLQTGATSRTPMTIDQFISNLRGANDNEDFPKSFLIKLYEGIRDNPIEWQADKESVTSDNEDISSDGRDYRRQLELSVRKAQASLRQEAPIQRNFHGTSNTQIVRGLFEVSWYRFVAAITTLTDHSRNKEVTQACLDGLSYGASIAIMLGLDTERNAFTRVLAKITFVEMQGEQRKELARKLVSGEHLKQEWYSPLNMQAQGLPEEACLTIQRIVSETKEKISFERSQEKLRQIEDEFGGDVHLVDPEREFIQQGVLTKISTGRKKMDYTFFLFTDLLMYASEGVSSKYKIHRVIHLSLLRIVSEPSQELPLAFKIVSPQKSFVLLCSSMDQKEKWIKTIAEKANIIREKRKIYIRMAETRGLRKPRMSELVSVTSDEVQMNSQYDLTSVELSDSGSEVFTGDDAPNTKQNHAQRRYSQFIGYSDLDQQDMGSRTHCKLCIRSFTVFRRKSQCSYCLETICSDCCTHKCLVPGSGSTRMQRVCDACFGVLKGMVGEDIPIVN